MTERVRVNFEVAGNTYQFSGAKWFYNDSTVKKNIGAKLATEGTSGSTTKGIVITASESVKRTLVKLVAVYSGIATTAVGNAAQVDKPKRFTFYCDPDKAEDAIVNLPRKKIGGRSVTRVYRPLQRRYV
ncbi:MAG: hypothetical protein F6K11_09385 [Leptolyngbya sp. SIO3F4]|nr:hypothetical protein [Leptolyngbya sp. SIO3F4]